MEPQKKKLTPKAQEAREKKIALEEAVLRGNEQFFLNLLSLYPTWAALHRELGVYYGTVDNLALARHHLQRANCLNQESPSALTALAEIFVKLEENKVAELLNLKADQVRLKHRKKAEMSRRTQKQKSNIING